MQLDGKVSLVTGAGRRLGRDMALALASEGSHVLIHYNHSEKEALEVASAIQALGRRAVTVQADLAKTSTVTQLIDAGVSALGSVDILINSASIFHRGTVETTTEADWDRHFAVNLKAPFFLCQAFARQLGDRPGNIVNIADWRAMRPGVSYIAYTMTKAALITMTHSLAQALGPSIRVNAIAPGAILPPSGGDDGYFERLAPRLPLQHTGSPNDISHALLYLLGADFVTGEVLFVTGGQHL